MVKEFRKAILVAMALAAVVSACTPAQAQSTDDIQAQVATQVAMTVGAQGDMAAAVAGTLTAQVPAATATPSPTPISLNLPTVDPNLPTVTPFVVVPPSGGGGGGGGSNATVAYSCSWTEVKPKINVFKPGDPIDIVWIITNTGTKAWPSKKDLDYVSGTKFSPFMGQELPPLDSGDRVTISFEGNAPKEPGFYGMQYKVEGGLCWPAINIEVGKPRDP